MKDIINGKIQLSSHSMLTSPLRDFISLEPGYMGDILNCDKMKNEKNEKVNKNEKLNDENLIKNS